MPDEQSFTTHLLSVDVAVSMVGEIEGLVVDKAWRLWQNTLAIQAKLRARNGSQPSDTRHPGVLS
jgi:hypothetical protein